HVLARDNTLWQRTRKRAPPIFALLLVFGNQTKEAVPFVSDSGGEGNPSAQGKKIPQAIKLQRRAIGAHQRLDESAGGRIINVDLAVTEITDPKFAVNLSESPGRVQIPAFG